MFAMAELRAVTVSMRVMTAGDGYKYLLRTVVVGDRERSLPTLLTRCYSAEGTPPGRWLGSGLRGLGEGLVVEGDPVTEAQLQLLIGLGPDPAAGEPLGRAYAIYQTERQHSERRRPARGSPAALPDVLQRRPLDVVVRWPDEDREGAAQPGCEPTTTSTGGSPSLRPLHRVHPVIRGVGDSLTPAFRGGEGRLRAKTVIRFPIKPAQ